MRLSLRVCVCVCACVRLRECAFFRLDARTNQMPRDEGRQQRQQGEQAKALAQVRTVLHHDDNNNSDANKTTTPTIAASIATATSGTARKLVQMRAKCLAPVLVAPSKTIKPLLHSGAEAPAARVRILREFLSLVRANSDPERDTPPTDCSGSDVWSKCPVNHESSHCGLTRLAFSSTVHNARPLKLQIGTHWRRRMDKCVFVAQILCSVFPTGFPALYRRGVALGQNSRCPARANLDTTNLLTLHSIAIICLVSSSLPPSVDALQERACDDYYHHTLLPFAILHLRTLREEGGVRSWWPCGSLFSSVHFSHETRSRLPDADRTMWAG